MHQEPVESTQNSEMQIQCAIYQAYLVTPSLLHFGPTNRFQFSEKPLGSEENGLCMAPMWLEHSCKPEVSSYSDLCGIRHPYNSQHTPGKLLRSCSAVRGAIPFRSFLPAGLVGVTQNLMFPHERWWHKEDKDFSYLTTADDIEDHLDDHIGPENV